MVVESQKVNQNVAKQKAKSLTREERKKLVARKDVRPNPRRKGTINVSNKLSGGGMPSKNKKFGMSDGMQNSYEKHMESVIEKNMRKQNKLKLNGGGFIAKGCGAVMKPRKKVTTIS